MADHPHFLCIGAQRAGTTWLDHQLRRQPGIWLPPLKELHYFDTRDSGIPHEAGHFRRRHLRTRARSNLGVLMPQRVRARLGLPVPLVDPIWDATYFLPARRDLHWYTTLFQRAARKGYVTGEITPAYSMLSVDTIRTIHGINSKLKMLYILRNPVERVWSQAVKYLVRDKGRPLSDVSDAEFVSFIRSERCRSRSDYLTTLDRWLSVFPADQMLLVYFDHIRDSPATVIQQVTRFLGVTFMHIPSLTETAQTNLAATGLLIPDAVRREAAVATSQMLAGLVRRLDNDVVRAWLRDAQLAIR